MRYQDWNDTVEVLKSKLLRQGYPPQILEEIIKINLNEWNNLRIQIYIDETTYESKFALMNSKGRTHYLNKLPL